MIDVEAIRKRAEEARHDLRARAEKKHGCRYKDRLSAAVNDIEVLIREIDELRALCKHQHLIQVFGPNGEPTDAYTCVNCHKTFSKDAPLTETEDFTI